MNYKLVRFICKGDAKVWSLSHILLLLYHMIYLFHVNWGTDCWDPKRNGYLLFFINRCNFTFSQPIYHFTTKELPWYIWHIKVLKGKNHTSVKHILWSCVYASRRFYHSLLSSTHQKRYYMIPWFSAWSRITSTLHRGWEESWIQSCQNLQVSQWWNKTHALIASFSNLSVRALGSPITLSVVPICTELLKQLVVSITK